MDTGGGQALQAESMLFLLAEHQVDFVIIGGFALSAHGVVRGTKDVDIVPDPRAENLGRLAAALRALNAEVMLADDFDPSELGIVPDEAGLALGGNWVLRTRLGRLDVMEDVAGVRSYAALRSAAVERDVPDAGSFWFSGLDDLIAMKVAAGRPQDELDITSLHRARAPRHHDALSDPGLDGRAKARARSRCRRRSSGGWQERALRAGELCGAPARQARRRRRGPQSRRRAHFLTGPAGHQR